MKLFKLKSIAGDGLLYTLDMLVNDRIYLSTCVYMNDINEGIWKNTDENGFFEFIDIAQKFKYKVYSQRFTCFVTSVENHLMWAHYAGGFSGVAIEYELDSTKFDIQKISYIGTPSVSKEQMQSVLNNEKKLYDIGVLKQKDNFWSYEEEWRLFGTDDSEYITNIKPKSVILGPKQLLQHDILIKTAINNGVRVGYLVPGIGVELKLEFD